MNRSLRGILIAGAIAGVAAARPARAAAQDTSRPALSCASGAQLDAFLADVALARELEEEQAKAALAGLEPAARRMAAEAPDDAAAQYRLAAVLGAQLDHASGESKMRGAAEVRAQAERVLELDQNHAGASYMLGRIHASIMRMSGFKRFMAKQLFGGSSLEGASWEKAHELLEVAVREDPCVPEHHFELARVYAHYGALERAERELEYVRQLATGDDQRQARLRERADEFEREWRADS
jgi:hypothetical protein